MAFSPSVKAPEALQGSPSISGRESLLFRRPFLSNFSLPHRPPINLSLTLTFARRRNSSSAITSSSKKKKRNLPLKESREKEEDEDDVEEEEDALEVLFNQLEEDLKNDGISLDNDDDDDELDEISEEELSRLERELGLALGVDDDDDEEEVVEDEETLDEDEDVEMPLKLKNWQLRRLALALKTGRRKTSIKSLAAELCLDRATVLELLRDPPPNLLLLSATLPDTPTRSVSETNSIRIAQEEPLVDSAKEAEKVKKVPVHVMQQNWTARKRLKKVQVETLERVYRRSKRPTNAMISSIVQVTNLPHKRILKWFEDKRAEDGVPDRRQPYARSVPKSV